MQRADPKAVRSPLRRAGRDLLQWAMVTALLAATLLLGGWHVARFANHVQVFLALPSPLDGLEGMLLFGARQMSAGAPLYQPLQPDRVMTAPYPPNHFLALAAVERLAPPVADITEGPVFLAGRSISLAGMVGAALLLGLAVWRLGGSPSAGAIAACLWLAVPPVQLWATRIKGDPLALLFTAGGLLAAAWFFSRRSPPPPANPWSLRRCWPLVVAALAFALAFFTKQTAVAAPAATGLALLLTGGAAPEAGARGGALRRLTARVWRHLTAPPLLVFVGVYGLTVALVWVGLDGITGGMFTYNVWGLHPPSWWYLSRFLNYWNLLLPAWPLMLLALGGLGLALRGREPAGAGRSPWVFALSYALLGVALLLAAGAAGSHHNHLLEPHLALLLAGCSVAGASLRRLRNRADWPAAGGALLALALLLLQLWTLRDRPAWYSGEFDPARQDRVRFVELIMSQPGEVLADDVGLLVAAGRPLRYNDPSTMGPAISSGIWDQRALLAEVADRRFDLILMPFDATTAEVDPTGRWSPEFVAALREHYRLLYRDIIFSYVPK